MTWRNRGLQGLLATCLTLRMLPAIRFTGACELTRQLAHRLEAPRLAAIFDALGADPRRAEPLRGYREVTER